MNVDRTPKPCLHKRANHQHGDRLAYNLDRCRCLPCCAANSRYEALRTRLRAYGRGTPTGLVDAAPVRAHVERLQAAGMGWKRIADVAAVARGTMSRLLFGKPAQGLGPSKRISPVVAEKLLAVPLPTVEQLAGHAVVDGVGTRRRLQALVANGWTQGALARRMGMSVGNFNSLIHGHRNKPQCSGHVVAATARAVARLYDELWDQPGPATYGRPRALATAARYRWVPPLAWDDEAIDDPNATPAVETLAPEDRRRRDPEVEAEVLRLTALGVSARAIADRLGMTARTVQRIRARGAEVAA